MKCKACDVKVDRKKDPLIHANGCPKKRKSPFGHFNISKDLVQTSLLSFFGKKRDTSSFNVVEEVVDGKSVEVICLDDSEDKPLLIPAFGDKATSLRNKLKVTSEVKVTTNNTRNPSNGKRTKWKRPALPARKVYHSRMISNIYLPSIQKYLPEFKKIQDSTFTVDCFSYGVVPGITHYFLRLVCVCRAF